ncbi:MAG: GDP-fucose synthetase [Candidatus Yanofskybacteria bacterium RIFCSPHIGHO2_01_FULL_42_12]|uniref:GDP-L-fucose synthase n=1 Tax=Candidatus Yanofskybacteria bacterium RIFCSPLOWO2_01_FULL_42_49 TaxID=1802694 RepID=A0A1F8GCD6_9BACT|nr:MAG: GDP-fucose synthetase [Candidatus Yanofskybacteria bacterium RIFCSPHIGHO2_01_FULL_42_12]OGN22119.1 MAG: GDP-fucose synthetase [Candidatus Yanofskybacteria bacterium RIFCSPLOWO2_01_FULL_42_49]
MDKNSKIYIAGHTGLLGSAIVRTLKNNGFRNLVTGDNMHLDLTDKLSVSKFFAQELPEYVFLCAAKVGNIAENIKYPADFIIKNILIQQNVVLAAHVAGVKKLLFFGANCCYPRECPQPMREEYLMTGPLEPTNRAYAMAKLAGIEMCRAFNVQYGTNFIVAIPASMYGENDHFEHDRAHVLPDMIKKFHNAMVSDMPEVVLWGDGSPRREFIYVDDVADASVFLMDNFSPLEEEIERGDILINVGTGIDYSIAELADVVGSVVGYKGKIVWDDSKPNGMPRKLLDSSRLRAMGWQSKVDILEGIRRTYQRYIHDIKQI